MKQLKNLLVCLIVLVAISSTTAIAQNIGYTFKVDKISYEITSTSPLEVAVIVQNEGLALSPQKDRIKTHKSYYDLSSVSSLKVSSIHQKEFLLGMSKSDQLTGDIIIPAQVTHKGKTYKVISIKDLAFAQFPNLTSLTIPASVERIGKSIFYESPHLTAINVDESNIKYASEDGILYNKLKTELIYYPADKPGTSFSIPGSVKSIGESAFHSCSNLTSVSIPALVTSIERWAFCKCTNLKTVEVAWTSALPVINVYVFASVNLKAVILSIPKGKKALYEASDIWKEFNIVEEGGTPAVNMSRYITLTVQQGEQIKLNLQAGSAGTSVKIVSGSTNQTVTVGTKWIGFQKYTAGAGTMTIYGDITGFNCAGNGSNLTALDVSKNAVLEKLLCFQNNLQELDLSKNKNLKNLTAFDNPLSQLDLSKNTSLEKLNIGSFELKTLDLSKNGKLTYLACDKNNSLVSINVKNLANLRDVYVQNNPKLTSLDMSNCVALAKLFCNNNSLTTLTINNTPALNEIHCYGNKFSTQTLDKVYCQLTDRNVEEYNSIKGLIVPLYDSSDANCATVLATHTANATAKNWNVKYLSGFADINGTGTYVCGSAEVNMSRYITLTVQQGEQINLDLQAGSAGTSVKIVSGSTNQTVTVGTKWIGFQKYTAGAGTMTIYGDIIGLNCRENGLNLTALDISKNTKLELLGCYSNQLKTLDVSKNTKLRGLACWGNNFTTQEIDDIYCALPDHSGKEAGKAYLLYDSSDANKATVLATNAANATAKNWKVKYVGNDSDITGFTGAYVCGSAEVNMSRYITLTVQQGEQINLDLQAGSAGTSVKIVSGSTNQTVTVGTKWIGFQKYTAGAGTMTIYGDIIGLNCRENGLNLTALDISKNTKLTMLNCSSNWLSALDISKNTALTGLYCYMNQLSTLDVSKNAALTHLDCSYNKLSTLDISKNTKLELLGCYSNQLKTLDVSKNTKLKELYCEGNKFTTQAIDNIYCALPDRTGKILGVITPLFSSSDANSATVLATNAANATAKNWKVKYFYNDSDITGFTGTYVCGSSTGVDNVEQSGSIALYPNPVENMLYIKSDNAVERIAIYTVTGEAVKEAVNTDKINTSTLLPAIYIVKVQTAHGNTVRRIVKK